MTVRAGKFRRYHGENWLRRLVDLKTWALNIRDFFLMIIGIIQSLYYVNKKKPDIAFIKGGFVGVPIGLACVVTRTKFVTHDSDTVPGLANKIISRWASWHAVGMPVEYYDYNKSKTSFTGIPIEDTFQYVSREDMNRFRDELSIPRDARVVCITGGSLGASRLNTAISPIMVDILSKNTDLYVIHQTGLLNNNLYDDVSAAVKKRIISADFFNDLYKYTGAANVVITRAGATTIASLAIQKKPIIVIPNPMLTGGHQTKNAQHLEHSQAAVVISEDDIKSNNVLVRNIEKICTKMDYANNLSEHLGLLARPNAAKDIADIIEKIGKAR